MSPATAHMSQAGSQLNSYGRRHPGLYILGGTVLLTVGAMGYWFGIAGGSSESFGNFRRHDKNNRWQGSKTVESGGTFPLADKVGDRK
ncbi:uncharacterized protein V2V93DRAFT_381472 [Kockiozyma suomiensis]|uniref:uncharacterized protein n=1 Tax=Kockiozyma suomiensis TaxID=1337062 RepID=UPI0033441836